ncbi:hypothetical protein KEU06_09250 [Pseudaminobacter sp. 19-2017]|uniref:Uncharacterized protein n=1 Tax=Pseudaminobacter soli (ex Zhang et al. 2022) TaxID=2831468 RepID=A0A942E0T9_9HYPH|nr:hypothetical protein [Pseudaminobacter soli]MBS3648790.1 hypothetical protein [Pseudaminobacter soli]
MWYDQYQNKLVGFVVETRRGMFKPLIGKCIESDGDDDCFISVIGNQPPQETLDQALAFFAPDQDKFVRVFTKPNKSGGMMGHWLWALMFNEDGVNPRKIAT